MSREAIEHLEAAITCMPDTDWLIEYLRNRDREPSKERRGLKRKAEVISPVQNKRIKPDLIQADWDHLKTKRFPTWAQKLRGEDPPKIALFVHQLEPERLYTTREIEDLLTRSGFDSANWALGMLQTATANNGYGFVLQRVANHYRLSEELVPSHKLLFPGAAVAAQPSVRPE